jgi:hypothetical protein
MRAEQLSLIASTLRLRLGAPSANPSLAAFCVSKSLQSLRIEPASNSRSAAIYFDLWRSRNAGSRVAQGCEPAAVGGSYSNQET